MLADRLHWCRARWPQEPHSPRFKRGALATGQWPNGQENSRVIALGECAPPGVDHSFPSPPVNSCTNQSFQPVFLTHMLVIYSRKRSPHIYIASRADHKGDAVDASHPSGPQENKNILQEKMKICTLLTNLWSFQNLSYLIFYFIYPYRRIVKLYDRVGELLRTYAPKNIKYSLLY